MNIFIVEDEELSRNHLRSEIAKHLPNFNIIGEATSVNQSITWLKKNTPDLIFMDIQLSDGLCFEIFKHLTIETPIIFTTAYDHYAIQAFQENGIGYLLKPVNATLLLNAIDKFQRLTTYNKFNIDLQKLVTTFHPTSFRHRISIQKGEKISFLNIHDIAYFFSEETVTFAVLKNGERKLIDNNLSTLEQELDPKYFFRITRNCITHIDDIESINKYFNSRLKVFLKPSLDKELLISRIRSAEFRKWLDQ